MSPTLRMVGEFADRCTVLPLDAEHLATGQVCEELAALLAEALGCQTVDGGVRGVAKQRDEFGEVEEGLGHGSHVEPSRRVGDGQDDRDEVRGVTGEKYHRDSDEHLGVLSV